MANKEIRENLTPATPHRLVLLASGEGSLAKSLIQAALRPNYPATVVSLISDRPNAPALAMAAGFGVSTQVIELANHSSRTGWSKALCEAVTAYEPDWVISVGFGKIIGPELLQRFRHRVLNTHPSLLPKFPGSHAVSDALQAGESSTGASIHVVDEGIDTGPVIEQKIVPIRADDDINSLHERIKVVERQMLVATIKKLATGHFDLINQAIVLRNDAQNSTK